ncbi:mRNA export factor [Babesia microti strain RI]|uniref:mRNA export factor n=1 Tax=Babesia microti (strain RI) TaxID=1133968 RepID=I7IPT7_BABMR|nr:mRNA export factor [Babesia microti strain RI]CCF73210.1 mRNA export factor [Babesia microti strain RI]|eukprot:XP_012647819.1 mRNA export factor [Babesia microti strain RI]
MAYNRNLGDNPKPLCLTNIPDDSISSIRWSNPPNSLFIAAGSWDKTLRVWQISSSFGSNLSSTFKVSYMSNAPILSIGFSQDNTKLFAGSCDNTVRAFDLTSGNQAGVIVGQHQKPVIGVYHFPQQNAVITGGWDGMVAIWDMRQQNPAWSRMLNSKIFAMDFKSNIICTADSKLRANYWNVNNLNDTNTIPLDSSLRTQVRALALFPEVGDESGAGFTSIGGRCVVNYFSPSHRGRNFSFKCHRTDLNGKGTYVYPVNGIDFYGKYGTFVTGGGDGNFTIWDKENKTRVKMFNTMDSPIVDVKFNSEHNFLAYATSYDWHKGLNRNLMSSSSRTLQIVQLREEYVKPKPKAGSNRR